MNAGIPVAFDSDSDRFTNNNTFPVFLACVSSFDSLSVYNSGLTSSWSFNAVGFRPDKCNLLDGRPFMRMPRVKMEPYKLHSSIYAISDKMH